jgi:ABC-type cobalamin/Fe3+-siderophores transport system ATPase subunit
MKIIRLESENVKRIHAVSITPTGDVVEITGENGNGKTSVLDCIWWALAGTAAIQEQPIRRGADKARIQLDLGDLIVTRTFKRKDENEFTTALKVENSEGASYKAPQDMLNALVSGLTFDPLSFLRLKAREQFDMLCVFVPDVDFQKIDDLNRGDFERRTEQTRKMKEAQAAADLIVIDETLPEDTTPEDDLLDEIANAGTFNAALQTEAGRRHTVRAEIQRGARLIASKHEEAKELRRKAALLDREADDLAAQIAADGQELDALPPIEPPKEIAQIRAKLLDVQKLNASIQQAAENRRKKATYTKLATDAALLSDELTAKINERNGAKAMTIKAAKMPIEGLGFGDGCVTLNGLPFDQASDAEQLRASIAIAMKKNSRLRVIRVRDGSLLDQNSMKILAEMAAQSQCQVWIETVRATSESAIVISDGSVKGAA